MHLLVVVALVKVIVRSYWLTKIKIECIIDDGILIHDNKIVAGFSAKKESSRLKAVRRAIFQDEVQVKSVREQLDKINPNKLMIIGTSDNMVKKINKSIRLTKSRSIYSN